MALIQEIGHIFTSAGVVCHGCGAVIYMAGDSLGDHLKACEPVREYNRKRLSGEPL